MTGQPREDGEYLRREAPAGRTRDIGLALLVRAERAEQALAEIRDIDDEEWADDHGWLCVSFIQRKAAAALASTETAKPTCTCTRLYGDTFFSRDCPFHRMFAESVGPALTEGEPSASYAGTGPSPSVSAGTHELGEPVYDYVRRYTVACSCGWITAGSDFVNAEVLGQWHLESVGAAEPAE